MNTQR